MELGIDMHIFPRNIKIYVHQVSFENVEYFLSYEVRLKFCNHEDAKGITVTKLVFFEKQTI